AVARQAGLRFRISRNLSPISSNTALARRPPCGWPWPTRCGAVGRGRSPPSPCQCALIRSFLIAKAPIPSPALRFMLCAHWPLLERTLVLGMGAARRVPSWDAAKNQFVPVMEANVTLSFDHRVLDGGAAGRLVARVAQLLATPDKL